MTKNDNTLRDFRKQRRLNQDEMADILGIPRTTYAYKEKTGTFEDVEKKQIAKYLKVDMNTITWTSSSVQSKSVTDDRDSIIRQQQEQIIKLEAELNLLKELYQSLLQNR